MSSRLEPSDASRNTRNTIILGRGTSKIYYAGNKRYVRGKRSVLYARFYLTALYNRKYRPLIGYISS